MGKTAPNDRPSYELLVALLNALLDAGAGERGDGRLELLEAVGERVAWYERTHPEEFAPFV